MSIVSRFVVATVFAAGALPVGATLVQAFEKFDEFRIAGAEIQSVILAEPAEVEAPFRFTITTVHGENIEFEADNAPEFLEDCRDNVERIIGSTGAYVQIVVLANAESMNGSLLVQCTDLHTLIPR